MAASHLATVAPINTGRGSRFDPHVRLLCRRGELVLIGARGTLSRLLDLTELDDSLSLADGFSAARRGD